MSGKSANKTPIELLAPARDKTVGKAAIDCGADAVYTGAPRFGARQAAGNSKEDIAELAEYAHKYGAKVWVALNTLLRDDEMEEAERIAWEMYEAGADGLIVQDMGLPECNLPPIRLHASTQCNNTSKEKVRWLEDAGFKRVVLARELGIEEIAAIRKETHVELEAFVHGALCVSYSGECYLSEALQGRSANRGACAQLCRMPYDLLDKDGNCMAKQKYILSLHDMDRSRYLREMLDAGITSLKIEGRLKGEEYVRNVVTYYRQALDKIFSEPNSPYRQASEGITAPGFVPDISKTFHRGATDYFLHQRTGNLANWDSPKSTGEYIGTVLRKEREYIEIDRDCDLHNGDGLTFGDKGFSVNGTSGRKIYPNQMPDIQKGTALYRNYDKVFVENLLRAKPVRKIPVAIHLKQTGDTYRLQIGTQTKTFQYTAQKADKPEQAAERIKQQLQKLGGTQYAATEVCIETEFVPFIPAGVLNQWRRETLEEKCFAPFDKTPTQRDANRQIRHPKIPDNTPHDYRLNVLNRKARDFYAQCGVTDVAPAYEAAHAPDANLMRCKYCILYERGQCRKQHKAGEAKEPYYLRTQNGKLLRLEFDCRRCEMRIKN